LARYNNPNDFSSCTIDAATLAANNAGDAVEYFKKRIGQLLNLAKSEEIFQVKLQAILDDLAAQRQNFIDQSYYSYKNNLYYLYTNYTQQTANFTKIMGYFDKAPGIEKVAGTLNKEGFMRSTECCKIKLNFSFYEKYN
jgi:hypothetical protein